MQVIQNIRCIQMYTDILHGENKYKKQQLTSKYLFFLFFLSMNTGRIFDDNPGTSFFQFSIKMYVVDSH